MEVFVANEQSIDVDEARLSALAHHALDLEDVDGAAELSVLLVERDHIRRLNQRFAGDDHETDVLSFPMMEDEEESLLLGDVVICPTIGRRNADRLGRSLAEELDLLLVHGTLHLLGYDHQEEEDGARMEVRTKEILASFDPAAV
ncbi:MAG: rRNA maturation RNase YbeY [Actinomycetota bacterium]